MKTTWLHGWGPGELLSTQGTVILCSVCVMAHLGKSVAQVLLCIIYHSRFSVMAHLGKSVTSSVGPTVDGDVTHVAQRPARHAGYPPVPNFPPPDVLVRMPKRMPGVACPPPGLDPQPELVASARTRNSVAADCPRAASTANWPRSRHSRFAKRQIRVFKQQSRF